jgi:hypothetical protein
VRYIVISISPLRVLVGANEGMDGRQQRFQKRSWSEGLFLETLLEKKTSPAKLACNRDYLGDIR